MQILLETPLAANAIERKKVAVLCAARNSIYHTLSSVDVYDLRRNALTFVGEMPIVAHPPCRAWSAFCAHQAKPLPGEKELGLWCCEQLRRWGGILEHPAHSRLFAAADLPLPGESRDGLWTASVLQYWWGDSQKKATWLCFSGIDRDAVNIPYRLWMPNGDRRRWQLKSKHQRAATCPQMAEWLVKTAALAA